MSNLFWKNGDLDVQGVFDWIAAFFRIMYKGTRVLSARLYSLSRKFGTADCKISTGDR